MIHTITSGWVAHQRDSRVVLRSETTELAIDVGTEAEAAEVVFRLTEGWSSQSRPSLAALREELIRRSVIRPKARPVPDDQSRQVEYWRSLTNEPVIAVERIAAATVAVVGIGGIGAVAVEHLIAAGVRQLIFVDTDEVEHSNMNRQFIYKRSDVGASKVEAARAYVLERMPDAEVHTIRGTWTEDAGPIQNRVYAEADFVLSAIDKPDTRTAVSVCQSAWDRGVPSLWATAGLHRSVVSPVFSPRQSQGSPTSALVLQPGERGSTPLLASHGPINTLAATLAADQILHHLAGLNGFVEYDRPMVVVRQATGAIVSSRVARLNL
ncbi:ThiF family adenylyltransferase [Microbacterium sp. lyk4-40-TSB-66]|uniref:ThiF family adenylyltransferase n=1 Tax=Microbacterium sp. lyk4-40-TSB-66 TaxID=3040294 RepID=UPI00254FC31B|nr:ThiF family adenylyltransferase [Microbacterium sp. lyk4-40-TSB-66]